MKRKVLTGCITAALFCFTWSLRAQTLEEGIRMYKYQRYESAIRILTPLAASNPQANYYMGLSEAGRENNAAAKTIFQKFPDDNANVSGLAMMLIEENKIPEAMALLNKTAAKAKKKDWSPYRYAADAITYSEGADPNTAVEWYKKALEVEKKRRSLYWIRGCLPENAGRWWKCHE